MTAKTNTQTTTSGMSHLGILNPPPPVLLPCWVPTLAFEAAEMLVVRSYFTVQRRGSVG